MSDSLHQRGNALENQFFSKLDAELLDQLKTKQELERSVEEVSHLTGIQDRKALEGIIKIGVQTQTIAALRLFPLVAVAWADGRIDDGERLTIRTIAATHLKLGDSPVAKLLDSWLARQPSGDAFESWESYAKALIASLKASEADSLRDTLLNEIRVVAEASGGLLGWGSVSTSENSVISRIESALTRTV